MPKLRHEINMCNGAPSFDASNISYERGVFSASDYNGSASTVCLELVYTNTTASAYTVTPMNGATSYTAGNVTLAASTSTTTVVRSTAFASTDAFFATGDKRFSISPASAAGLTIRSARYIVLQDTGTATLTASKSQFEIGGVGSTTYSNTASAALTSPKYWTYTAANWSGTNTFTATATYRTNNSSTTITLQQDDGTLSTWSDVATLVSAGASTTNSTVLSVAFTPVDGRTYRIAAFRAAGGGTRQYWVYNAKIIVTQSSSTTSTQYNGEQLDINGFANDVNTNLYGGTSANANYKVVQSFTPSSNMTITAVGFFINKSTISLTDNFVINITTSIGGTSLANGSLAFSSIVGGGAESSITLNTSLSLSAGTKYYIEFTRSGARDTTNYCSFYKSTTDVLAGGEASYWNGTTWNTITEDIAFETGSSTTIPVTQLEEQYLVANQPLAAGTALQNYPTTYDPAEWSMTRNQFFHQVAASAANTSVVEIDTAAGSQISGSVVSSPNVVAGIGQGAIDSNNGTATVGTGINGSDGVGQTFTGNGGYIFRARAAVNRSSLSMTGTITAKIFAHTGTFGTSGVPTGTALASSDAVDVSNITNTSGFNDLYFTFPTGYQTVNTTKYCVSFEGTGLSGGFVNFGIVAGHAGNGFNLSGGNYTAVSDDYEFGVYAGSLMTMPTSSGNLDVKATTNSGSLNASHIVAVVTVYSAAINVDTVAVTVNYT